MAGESPDVADNVGAERTKHVLRHGPGLRGAALALVPANVVVCMENGWVAAAPKVPR